MNKSNNVKVLDDGRVEIRLLMALPLFEYRKWVKFYLPECELVIEDTKITAIRCTQKSWNDALKNLTPKSFGHFQKIIEQGTGKRLHRLAILSLNF